MKDPRRLLEGDASELELRLLTLVQHEEAPSAAPRRLAAQLGLPVSALGLQTIASGTQPVSSASGMPAAAAAAGAGVSTGWLHGVVGKLVLVGVLGALAGGAVVGVMAGSPSASPSAPSTAAATATASVSAAVAVAEREVAAAGGLDGEVAELAKVRSTLHAGRAQEALVQLGSFERAHPASVLTQEARALRIEALLATRDMAAAHKEGASFLRSYPDSPHRARVQALLSAGRSLR